MELTPELLLNAYCQGAFPMADGRDGDISWYSADPRAIQPFVEGDPLGAFHLRRSLAKRVRNGGLTVTSDRCFADVIHACATAPRKDEDGGEAGTWISPPIEKAYTQLHQAGFAHSVEAWRGDDLVGGIYGVAIGGAFFGESMFSREPYASQVAYVWLIDHLRTRGFTLFDTQFVNPHIAQFGVVEVPQDDYFVLLDRAITLERTWSDAN